MRRTPWKGPRKSPQARCGFIQLQPVKTELADSLGEPVEIQWLANIAIGAEAVAVNEILLFLG